ncbi:hypothetical protein DFH28DRAFT_889853 [Melampsora americana]|nr:hypothetical protein DFH28DRAFT_889853 [Melampsora americana]
MAKNPSAQAALVCKQAEKQLAKKDLCAHFCRAIVQDQHGAPSTATVIWIHPNCCDLKQQEIHFGHVILVDALTGKFVASIYTLHPDDERNKHLRDKFHWAVQLLYHHGIARRMCSTNKAAKDLGAAKSGEMYPMGSCGASDAGKSGGMLICFSLYI